MELCIDEVQDKQELFQNNAFREWDGGCGNIESGWRGMVGAYRTIVVRFQGECTNLACFYQLISPEEGVPDSIPMIVS